MGRLIHVLGLLMNKAMISVKTEIIILLLSPEGNWMFYARTLECKARGSTMSAREIQDQKVMALEMMVQQAADANADVSASPLPGDTICSIKSRRDCTLESKAEDGSYEPVDTSLLPVTRVDAANLIRAL